jgi:hypothetical protein
VTNPFKTFRDWEGRYALTFVGVVLSIVFFIVPYYQEKNPGLRIEVVSRANVVDIRETLSDLEIFYKGASLRSNQESLVVVTLKISNDGGAPITLNAYDPSAPVGVLVYSPEPAAPSKVQAPQLPKDLLSEKGQGLQFPLPVITEAEVIFASNDYLSQHVVPEHTAVRATFKPVILERGEYFQLKLLILRPENRDFVLVPVGKIAGVRKIAFVEQNPKEHATPSLWAKVFGGSLLIQLTRAFAYSAAGLLGMLAFVTILDFRRPISRRRRLIRKFIRAAVDPIPDEYQWLLNFYITEGEQIFPFLDLLLQNGGALPADTAGDASPVRKQVQSRLQDWVIRTALIRDSTLPKPNFLLFLAALRSAVYTPKENSSSQTD